MSFHTLGLLNRLLDMCRGLNNYEIKLTLNVILVNSPR